MPEIQDVMDVTLEELSTKQQLQLKEAIDQFQQKCLMSFSKNRSGVPFLKSDMPRVLLPGEPDTTTAEEKQEVFGMVQKALEDIMARHNTAFLNSFRQMMVGVRRIKCWCQWPTSSSRYKYSTASTEHDWSANSTCG
jgi:hypothetical protein